MKITFRILLAAALLPGMLASCKKDRTAPDAITPATKLRGKVELNDKWGNIIFEGRSGTQAVVSGEFQNWSATTDNTGRFEFSDLPDGTYSVTVSRDGFAPVQIHNVAFSKNSPTLSVSGEYQLLPTLTMGVVSDSYFVPDSTTVNIFYETEIIYIDTFVTPWITDIDTLSAQIRFRSRMLPVSPVPNAVSGYRLFVGKTPNTSPDNYLATVHGAVNVNQTNNNAGLVTYEWTQPQWTSLGIAKGDMVYVRIYGDAVNPISYDSPGGQEVFPNLSDSLATDMDMIFPF